LYICVLHILPWTHDLTLCDLSSESFRAVFMFKKKKEKHIYFHMALLIIQHVVHVHWSSLHFYGLNQVCDYFKMRRFLLLTVSCTDNRTFQIKVCRESPSVWPLTKSNFSLTQHCIYGMIFAHLQCLYIELMLTAFKVHTVS